MLIIQDIIIPYVAMEATYFLFYIGIQYLYYIYIYFTHYILALHCEVGIFTETTEMFYKLQNILVILHTHP